MGFQYLKYEWDDSDDFGIFDELDLIVDRIHHGKEEQAYFPETMIFKSMVLQQDHSTSFFIH